LPHPFRDGAFPLGRASGRPSAAPGAAGGGRVSELPRLHEHARAGGNVVPDAGGGSPGPHGAHRSASRVAGPGGTRKCGAGSQGRPAEVRGVHLQSGPGRGLLAGGTGAADRVAEGRGPAASTRREKRPRSLPDEPDHHRSDARVRAGGDGGRPRRRAGGTRGAKAARGASSGRSRPASRHRGAGRRVPGRGDVPGGALDAGLP
jgi:hypothetical protein